MVTLVDNIDTGNGFDTRINLSSDELNEIRLFIRKQYLANLKKSFPQHIKFFSSNAMEDYHNLDHLIDHKKMWPKSQRCLPNEDVLKIKEMNFMIKIKNEIGDFYISDEDNIGRPEIYWRLVRPNQSSDVGPLHADSWFWDLNQKNENINKRFKLWVPLFCEKNDTGFRFVPNSHKKKWKFVGDSNENKVKPIPKFDESKLNIKKFSANTGNTIIFNDNLLHGGYVTNNKTRVSLEFTMIKY